jgi:hypothetical protein
MPPSGALGVFGDGHVDVRGDAEHTPRHAAADHGTMSRRDANAPERKDCLLEVRLLDLDHFDLEILHPGLVEDHSVGGFVGRDGGASDSGERAESEREAFHVQKFTPAALSRRAVMR